MVREGSGSPVSVEREFKLHGLDPQRPIRPERFRRLRLLRLGYESADR
jgi:hypothetical protein